VGGGWYVVCDDLLEQEWLESLFEFDERPPVVLPVPDLIGEPIELRDVGVDVAPDHL
jgi:hypothetical protein